MTTETLSHRLFSRVRNAAVSVRLWMLAVSLLLLLAGGGSAVAQGLPNCITIFCPPGLTNYTCTDFGVLQNYPLVVSNTCVPPPQIAVNCNPPPGTPLPIGVNPVRCVVTADGSAIGQCNFTITVVKDMQPALIQCPGNIVLGTCTNGESVTYPPPVIMGTTDPSSVTVTCNPPSGSFFPPGTRTVTCCVVDQCNRTNFCAFTVTVLPGSPCVQPPPNMVLWLPLDEPLGPVAHNIVAGAPHGAHVNGPIPFTGQHVLNSLCFDGVNDFVRVPNYSAIALNNSDLSIDAWIRRVAPDQGRRAIVSKLGQAVGAASPRGYEFQLNSGVLGLHLSGAGVQNFNSGILVPADGNWHHVAVTVRRGPAGAVRFYLDGALANTQPATITPAIGNNSSLFVGATTLPGPSNFFRGYIDEVEIFRRVLTTNEVQKLWAASRVGKCKIKCSVPWDVPFPAGVNCVNVNARVWNCSGVPVPITWIASGPVPFPTPAGAFVLPPFTCTNFPVTLCRPAINLPVGSQLIWNFAVFPGNACPRVCMGSVLNPGPVLTVVPTGPVAIPGTNQTANVRVNLNGLPPGVPVRLRSIGPDMEPDQSTISLNGLPPGQPWIRDPVLGLIGEIDDTFDVPIRFVTADPVGLYTILLEGDVTGDGQFDTLASFGVENPLVPPPTLALVRSGPTAGWSFSWKDEGEGPGTLEVSEEVTGPWRILPGVGPGSPMDTRAAQKQFFRIAAPVPE